MLVRKQQIVPQRPSSSELNALAGHAVFCSEFKYRRGTEIFGEAEPIQYLYQVKSGAVRSYKLLADGRRQIMAFHLPGDIFGVENGAVHRFTAEAIVETIVRLTDRQNVAEQERGSATTTNNVLRLVTGSLQHAETHMLLLGRKTAIEKVAAFLIEMDVRLTAAGIMSLPMNRRDIADYLGLTLETVSRALSQLRDRDILSFIGQSQRQIILRDRAKLTEFDQ
ncbi:helix-turn-helix domain-containing protein [Bradyrhizobium sp. CSS354]|jgi:CRP/FNR family transcriptional regulator, nitrogen fixation regulation protein|uniref:helix-turn-helix domain-containing protein n=1 Tax=Bradyrhizobium sp. CSS354 TaxID=2699172 RepID=UPI0023AFE9D4|nr:helix-turn-helix domain-containing protein [Bradyrhizobium sp. CSS354]MDE5459930.1 helix-turn-helix domain-containing protein [Bradyrhizobium sp. CSS354]